MRTKPAEDFPNCRGVPSASAMAFNSRSLRSRPSPPGFRYGSNESLNHSESENYESDDGLHYESSDRSYGWNVDADIHEEVQYTQNQTRHKPQYENRTHAGDQKRNATSPKKDKYPEERFAYWLYFVPVFIMLIFGSFFYPDEANPTLSNEVQLRDDIKQIRRDFPSQEKKMWYTFAGGIKDVVGDPTHPSVFVMLYKDHEETATCLASKIARVAMNFLNSTELDPIILDGVELGKNKTLLNDYAEVIAYEKQRIKEHRTMIVKNLHSVPGRVAQSFHSLCDMHSPVVDKAVYLFTLKATRNNNEDSATAVAQKELEQKWRKELDKDILMALISRITDAVVFVESEENLASSCAV